MNMPMLNLRRTWLNIMAEFMNRLSGRQHRQPQTIDGMDGTM